MKQIDSLSKLCALPLSSQSFRANFYSIAQAEGAFIRQNEGFEDNINNLLAIQLSILLKKNRSYFNSNGWVADLKI
jgi:hypothetical protein